MNNKILFVLYAWGSTALYVFGMFWLSSIPFLTDNSSSFEVAVKLLFKMTLYGILFLLIFRSFLATFRVTVARLSKWHSEREAHEDMVFVFIIETLLVIISVLLSLIVAIADEFFQLVTVGRQAEFTDVLVSLLGILLAAILVIAKPTAGELEIAIKSIFFDKKK